MQMATNPMSAAGQDLLEILRQDHLTVDELFGRYADTTDEGEKLRIVERIFLELMPHAQAEEEIFYPALRDAASDDAAVDDAYDEHAGAKKTLEGILSAAPDDMTYDLKVKVLQKEIQQHVRDEETILFQEAQDSGLDMAELSRRFLERKRELQQQFQQQLAGMSRGPGGALSGGSGPTPSM
jgi:hemerythrin superfamily protein